MPIGSEATCSCLDFVLPPARQKPKDKCREQWVWHTDRQLFGPWTSIGRPWTTKYKICFQQPDCQMLNHQKKTLNGQKLQLQVGPHVLYNPLQGEWSRLTSEMLLGLWFCADFWIVQDRLQSHQSAAMERMSHTTKEKEPTVVPILCVSCSGYPSLQCWNSCRGTGNADVTSRWVATKYDQPISGWCLQLTTG